MAGPSLGRGRGRGRYKPLAEINVTPMVDVMLVLLIVFMVAAPLMTSGVTIDLPKANAAPLSQDSTPLTVSINAESHIFLQETEVTLADLVSKLKAAADNKLDRRIFVRGDRVLNYGLMMNVIVSINQAGFTKVSLLVEQTGAPVAVAPATTAPATTTPSSAPAATPAPAAPAASSPAPAGPGRGR